MTEGIGKRGGAEQVKDGKVCRECAGFKPLGSGQFGIVRG